MNILVMAANNDVRFIVSTVLRRSGNTVLETRNEHDATEAASVFASPIQIGVIDLDATDGDAMAFGKRLTCERPEIRILFISPHRNEHVGFKLAQLESKPAAFLERPFMPKDLLGAITALAGAPLPNH